MGRSVPSIPLPTHRVCLVLAAVELVAVVEDVLVGGVETGLHTVLHHLAGSWGALQLLDLVCRVGMVLEHPQTQRRSTTGQHNPNPQRTRAKGSQIP